jgi:hypothetical protein
MPVDIQLFTSCNQRHQTELDQLAESVFREGKNRGIEIEVLPIQPTK